MLSFLMTTIKHKLWVLFFITRFCLKLIWRGITHDLSKFSIAELKGYSSNFHEFKHSVYGTKQYTQHITNIQKTINHHYKHNPHHPNHYKGQIELMSLLDIVEMYMVWKAASKKYLNGNLRKSLQINTKRFKLDKQLSGIFKRSQKI